jgi:hypothetical protein
MAVHERPSGATGAIITTLVGSGDSGTPDYYIRTIDGTFDYGSPDREITGDGDYMPKFTNNGMLYADWKLNGAMVASQAIGLANIVDSNDNPTTGILYWKVGGTRKLGGRYLIRRIRGAWKRAGWWVGISILLRASHNTSNWSTSSLELPHG